MSPVSMEQRRAWVSEELERIAKRGSIRYYPRPKRNLIQLLAYIVRAERR